MVRSQHGLDEVGTGLKQCAAKLLGEFLRGPGASGGHTHACGEGDEVQIRTSQVRGPGGQGQSLSDRQAGQSEEVVGLRTGCGGMQRTLPAMIDSSRRVAPGGRMAPINATVSCQGAEMPLTVLA